MPFVQAMEPDPVADIGFALVICALWVMVALIAAHELDAEW